MIDTLIAFCMAYPPFLWSGAAILALLAYDLWSQPWP